MKPKVSTERTGERKELRGDLLTGARTTSAVSLPRFERSGRLRFNQA